MPFSFPSSPTVGQQSTQNGRLYQWSGSAWELVAAIPPHTHGASQITSGVFATARLGTGSATAATYLRGDGAWAADPRWDLFLPPAPTSVTATAGESQATVSWAAPSMPTYAPPITDYIVQYSSNSGSTWTTFSDGTSTTTSATVTGLTNGTAYTFRVAAVNGIGTGAASTASSAVTPASATPALLLHMDGANGSTAFTDSAPGSLAVTANGNAQLSTAKKKFGSASAVSDGAGDYLTLPNAAFGFGSNDFTIEWWQYIDAAELTNGNGNQQALWGNGRTAGVPEGMCCYVQSFDSDINKIVVDASIGGSWVSPLLASSATFTGQQWQHVAFVRSGTSYSLYLNGVQVATATNAGTLQWPETHPATILSTAGSAGEFTGSGKTTYIDEFRIVTGTAVYAGNFTPPTAPFA